MRRNGLSQISLILSALIVALAACAPAATPTPVPKPRLPGLPIFVPRRMGEIFLYRGGRATRE